LIVGLIGIRRNKPIVFYQTFIGVHELAKYPRSKHDKAAEEQLCPECSIRAGKPERNMNWRAPL
jgi:hypothetical protein